MKKEANGKRSRNIFDPNSDDPFRLSRSKIDFFLECSRCFYLDRRLGIGRPPGFPFTLNSAVDALLKKEFDIYRAKGSKHPLMETYGIQAVPFRHEMINEWRNNFKGIQFLHRPTNFLITGAIDDIWVNDAGELFIVDYKATSTSNEIDMDAPYRQGFKRQMEIYQWLFRRNDFKVSDTGYFVYANGEKDKEAFDGKLEFKVEVIPYKGSDKWVEGAIVDAHKCLIGELPDPVSTCEYCAYRREASGEESF